MLALHRRAPDTTLHFDWAQSPSFSPDERWVTWIVTPSDSARAQLTTARQPVRNRAVYMEPGTLRRGTLAQVANAGFDATLLSLALCTRSGGPGGLQLFGFGSGTLTAPGTTGYPYRQMRWRRHAPDLVALRPQSPKGTVDLAARERRETLSEMQV